MWDFLCKARSIGPKPSSHLLHSENLNLQHSTLVLHYSWTLLPLPCPQTVWWSFFKTYFLFQPISTYLFYFWLLGPSCPLMTSKENGFAKNAGGYDWVGHTMSSFLPGITSVSCDLLKMQHLNPKAWSLIAEFQACDGWGSFLPNLNYRRVQTLQWALQCSKT